MKQLEFAASAEARKRAEAIINEAEEKAQKIIEEAEKSNSTQKNDE